MPAADYTSLAPDYAKYRPDYSSSVLRALIRYTEAGKRGFRVADIGAGTGIWTKMLAEKGLICIAVEPNDAMRTEGKNYTGNSTIQWFAGSAEKTGLETSSVDWVTMASSFHWVNVPEALGEFNRILRPGGHLTVLWNPRNIEGNPFHEKIENLIYSLVPHLKRVSSGAARHARDYYQELISTGSFADVVFFEANHEVVMPKERYLGVWRSVYDIQQQAGPERFAQILAKIAELIAPFDRISVPYKTRAWTARKIV